MLFFGSLYQWVTTHLSGRINHFPLVRLIIYSLDKTVLYLLVFIGLRVLWRLFSGKKTGFGHEAKLFFFAAYLILLYMLTVFRNVYYPWQLDFHWDRSFAVINWMPLIETLKLQHGSPIDFWYQSAGNIAWFLPLGFGVPWVSRHFIGWFKVITFGTLASLSIESLQFLLISGVADIDDVIFNVIGTVLGYAIYRLFHSKRKRFSPKVV